MIHTFTRMQKILNKIKLTENAVKHVIHFKYTSICILQRNI